MAFKIAMAVLVAAGALHWYGQAMAGMQPLIPPVEPACISSPFGPRVLRDHPQAGRYHYGIDLPAPAGAPVVAIASGKIIRIQKKGPGGLEVLVQHDGFIGIYSHLGAISPAFAEGKRDVAKGEKIAVVGRTGVVSGTHVYFEMIMQGKPVDPAPYLGLSPCRRETHQIVASASPVLPPSIR